MSTRTTETDDLPSALPFVALLTFTWSCLSAWFWFFVDIGVPVYYSLLYISFLGMVEFSSGFGLELPDRRWLILVTAVGFVGWIFSLFVYFN